MDFDFSQLDARKFQHMAQALAIKVLGSDLTVLGDGPDGGRDAAFRGPVSFPGPAPQSRWDGYGVLQVKFRQRPQSTREDTAWFIEQVRSELAGWAADRHGKPRKCPHYLIFVTNVVLSAVEGSGGLARVERVIAEEVRDRHLPLRDWRVWHYDQLRALLEANPEVRQTYAALITPSDILHRTLTAPTTCALGDPHTWPLAGRADPSSLGVHRALTLDPTSALPPYVPRDQDEELHQHLEQAAAEGGLVVVAGQSTAGKTRSAAQKLVEVLGEYHLGVPDTPDEARQAALAILKAAPLPCVLWLDDADRFLGPDGLTPRLLEKMRVHQTVVLATIRTERYTAIMSPTGTSMTRTPPRLEANVIQARFLEQGSLICYDRRWSKGEVRRAREMGDPRLDRAAASAGQYGIAEWLAAGPQIHQELEAAWSPGAHPRGAALVQAAIELERAGLYRPLPRDLVIGLHELYLQQQHGHLLDPEPLEQAVGWATAARYGTTRPLQPTPIPDTWWAFDYLVDAAEQRNVPIAEATWDAAIDYADELPDDLYRIGAAAAHQGERHIAAQAWRPLAENGHGVAALGLGTICDGEEAEHWFRAAYEAGIPEGAHNLGVLYNQQGAVDQAITWYREAAHGGVQSSAQLLGQLHRDRGELHEAARWFLRSYELGDTLDALHEVASAYGRMGDQEKKEQWLLHAVDVGSYEALANLALFYRHQDDLDRAERTYRILYDSGDRDDAACGLGEIHLLRGDRDNAERFLCEALEHDSIIAAFMLARNFQGDGQLPHDWDEAVDALLLRFQA
ncbi:hypothetical protein [Streptomyces sp. NEAU-S77]|uniref:SEL1-like repeat protein n=1 Tax=Streptomyces sp. NEAU-S77 TaxID=3411033 RepID=UPI003B9E6085